VAVPRWARGLQILLTLGTGFLLTTLLARSSPGWGLAFVLPSAIGIWGGSWWLLAHRQVFLSPLLPVFTLALIFTVLTSIRFFMAEREVRERTRKLSLTQDAIIQSLAALTETRHHETGGHISGRATTYGCSPTAAEPPRFGKQLDDATVGLLFRLALTTSEGRSARPDPFETGAVDAGGVRRDETHTLYGSKTIRLARRLMREDAFFQIADDLV
jgi:hypothetical protein